MAVFPGSCVAVAFSDDIEVGVDASAFRQDLGHRRLASRVALSPGPGGASDGQEGSRGTSLLSSRSS